MSLAYWCILIAALLPYVWVVIAKSSVPGYDNRNPRGWLAEHQQHARLRNAQGAHLNALEAFAPFAAAVLMAQLAGVDAERVGLLAVAFVLCRVLHGVFYLANLAALRSLVWFAGFACVLALFGQAALSIG